MSTIETILRLRHELRAILAAVPAGSEIALLDEPVHRNIGDHLIQLGTERLFQEHDISVVARAHVHSYHRGWLSRRIGRDSIMVCSGGGHLGDLYPWHQQLREQVVADFPRHRVVVLPQSVHFEDEAARCLAAAAFRRHPDLHVFLRDRDSLDQAQAMGLPNLRLAPDMAHALYPLNSKKLSPDCRERRLYLLRRDREATALTPDTSVGAKVCDWPDLVSAADTLGLGLLAAVFRLHRGIGPPDLLDSLLDRKRATLVQRGIDLVDRHDHVVTSRLHGALLGLLLGKRVSILDSRTGKSRSYYETWLADNPNCEYGFDSMGS